MRSQTDVANELSVLEPQVAEKSSSRIRLRRFLIGALCLFVVCSILAILYLMMVWLPNQYRQQAARMIVPSIQSAEVDGSVFLGAYEQDNDKSDGLEPIEWIVLEKQADRALLISRCALDCVQFNTADTFVTWDRSTILTWLNTTFYYDAFNGAERAMLLTTEQLTDTNPYFDTDPGAVTSEKVFLPNIAQIAKYFPTEQSRLCQATSYTVSKGAAVDKETGNCIWWLRSPGFDASAATRVLMDGRINYCGYRVISDRQAVRPCVWVTFDPQTSV